jgi:hypothetical protein
MLTERDRALGHRLAGVAGADGRQDAMVLGALRARRRGHARPFSSSRPPEQALDANDLVAVIARAERAVACGADGELLGAVRQLETEARMWRNDLAASEVCGLEAMDLLPRGSPRWLKVTTIVATVSLQRGKHERLSRIAKQLLGPVEPTSAMGLHLIAIAQVARYLLRLGVLDLVEPLFERLATTATDMAHDPAVLGHVHAAFASRSLFEGDPVAAQAAFRAAYKASIALGTCAFAWCPG